MVHFLIGRKSLLLFSHSFQPSFLISIPKPAMGANTSRNSESGLGGGEGLDQVGGQLYVSLKMENYKLNGELTPHVYGSVPLVGSWDSSKAVSNSLRRVPLIRIRHYT